MNNARKIILSVFVAIVLYGLLSIINFKWEYGPREYFSKTSWSVSTAEWKAMDSKIAISTSFLGYFIFLWFLWGPKKKKQATMYSIKEDIRRCDEGSNDMPKKIADPLEMLLKKS